MKRSSFLRSLLALSGVATVKFGNATALLNNKSGAFMRIVHITDMHLLPQNAAVEGTAKVFEMIKNLTPQPDFILNGGDTIMDALHTEKKEVKEMWKIFDETVMHVNKTPMLSAIGNHDVFGWDLESATTDIDYGKQWAMDQMKMPARYYATKKNNWNFIVLDTIHIGDNNKGYKGVIDDEQIEWLNAELLKSKENNVCILSHIPLMSSTPLFHASTNTAVGYTVPASWMVRDASKFRNMFLKNKNVKLCLSGHTHMHDCIEYLGTTYLNNGAVSGNWWNGIYMDCPPAFSVVDLKADGTFTHQFIAY